MKLAANILTAAAMSLTLSVAAGSEALAYGTSSLSSSALQVPAVKAEADRASIKDYDLGKKNLALEGYDPVAYFAEFGGKAKKGDKKITTKHKGVLYRFSSEANKKAFLAEPERFEPMYGGWCAWAMTDGKGDKTSVDPKSFTIEDGRLYVFYDGFFADTRKSWRKKGGAPKLKSNADTNWTRFSSEVVHKGDAVKKAEEAERARKAKEAEKAKKDEKKGDKTRQEKDDK